ncbi:neurogenic locus notch homolog protein 2-like [Octopus sinensis]|uniref:Neurogenic locus notch homolog protein 2-like n=1 Tax=Octopus sinensis TaxID=2607531 RepID=A0A6P7U1A1_9MOLL|nr:neurogenic locus notch homolog protein 2-like [Octopus sinensis]
MVLCAKIHCERTNCKYHQKCFSGEICKNGGFCIDNTNLCLCPPGFTGPQCQNDINECSHVVPRCKNNGICHNTHGGFTCECQNGFHGTLCEIPKSLCHENYCLFNGLCTEQDQVPVCHCQPGRIGHRCQNIDTCSESKSHCPINTICSLNLSENKVECLPLVKNQLEGNQLVPTTTVPCLDCKNGICLNGKCLCNSNYYGKSCEYSQDLSKTRCENGGVFLTTRNRCLCPIGFVAQINKSDRICMKGYKGEDCSVQIDNCSPNPCQNNGTCINHVNSFTCQCLSQYTGLHCEQIEQKYSKSSFPIGFRGENYKKSILGKCLVNPCENGGVCISQNLSHFGNLAIKNKFHCFCVPGTRGILCEQFAFDLCLSNPCKNEGTCVQISPTKTVCKCRPFFFGRYCEASTVDCRFADCFMPWTEKCVFTSNSKKTTCICHEGYSGNQCSFRNQDCPTGSCDFCPLHCQNRGKCRTNFDGHSFCDCPQNYYGELY